MLPYYLLLRGWLHMGTDEWVVRSLSVLCSIATLPLFYLLGKLLFGTRVGLIGLVLLAVHPYHIRFAQEARGYSLMLLLVTGSTLLLVRESERPSRHRFAVWMSYVATSVLAAYAHFYASLAILAQWVSLVVAPPRRLPSRALVWSAAGIGVLLLPLAAFVWLGHADPAGWIPHPTVRRVEYLVYSALGGDNTPGARWFAYPVYAALLIAAAAAARASWKTQRRDSDQWRFVLCIAGSVLPIVLVLAVSGVKPVFVDKYLIECLPFVVLLMAVGIDHLRPRALSLGTLIVVLAFSVHALTGYYGRSDKDDWRSATHYVLTGARAGDAALFFPSFVVAPFEYYRRSSDTTSQAPTVVYPGTAGSGSVAAALAQVQDRYARLWAVFNQDGEEGARVRDALARRYCVVSERQFVGVQVVLYDIRCKP